MRGGLWCLRLPALYNAGLTLAFLFHNISVGGSYLAGPTDLFSSAGFLIKLLLLWTGALLVLALAGLLVVLPVSMFLAQGVLLALWKIFGRATGLDFGPLWFERYSMEVQPSWPAYIAIYSFAILMLFRTGIWFVRSPETSR